MTTRKIMREAEACARILAGAEIELKSIRAAFSLVSLEAAQKRAAAAAIRPTRPLRERTAGEPPPLPRASTACDAPRRTLIERLRSAVKP